MLLDLQQLNDNPEPSRFDEFWQEIDVLFNEHQVAVHEQKHSTASYLPFAINIKELIERVKTRKPCILTPSAECIRLQFCPWNPYKKNSMA